MLLDTKKVLKTPSCSMDTVDDIAAVMRGLAMERAHMVGSSMAIRA